MKKTTVVLISAVLVISFAALVYYGLSHSRGVPVGIEEQKRIVLEVPFIDADIDLAKGIYLYRWDSIAPKEIELMHQLMVLPWGRSIVSPISIKAFHNRKDIYFYMGWKDTTEDIGHGRNRFSDACAIMFPMDDKVQPSTLMMGFMGKANIWHWKAVQDREYWMKEQPTTEAYSDFYYPFEEEELFVVSKENLNSAVRDLMAIRVGTITPKETQDVEGRGYRYNGSWHVVFKRPLRHIDAASDAVFNLGEKRLCAFAVWEGASGDRGGRKSISDWVELEVKR